uniref:F-box domain-containing protein n=2 Tax=Caenorhabditis tropicalis TaxID=1561998 RepID=A0A1I7U361_9PELO
MKFAGVPLGLSKVAFKMTQQRRGLAFVSSQANNVRKITIMASTVAFEFNKATLKLRRSLHISPRNSPEVQRKSTAGGESEIESPGSTQSTSRKCSRRNRQLCAELSSFALYPLFGALSPSHFSSPNLLFQNEKKPPKPIVEFLQLSDTDICEIMCFLNPRSLLNLSQTCKRLRQLCLSNEENIEKRDVSSHEITISFNQIKRRTEVRLLKRERTRSDPQFTCTTIRGLLAPFSRALTKITFDTTVFVTDWMDEILNLHRESRLIPLSLVFTGGALTKGNQLTGADLRAISETEFVDFVSKLQPHLQEIQLSTSRMFKVNSESPGLLRMISMLSSFGIVYERPPLRFYHEEISEAITNWRSDSLSRSCDVYMRRPHDISPDMWIKMSGSVDESRIDPYTDEVLVSRITIKHSFLVHIDLVFHFH